MKQICDRFADGSLRHDNADDVCEQLSAEGTKRMDSFVFETIFRRKLSRVISSRPGMTVSFGWHIAYNRYGDPAYWLKLMNSDGDWNAGDEAMRARVLTHRVGRNKVQVNVLRVRCDLNAGKMEASISNTKGWGDWRPLGETLGRLPRRGKAVEPKPMKANPQHRADAAFKWLNSPAFRAELTLLSVQRRLMNCELRPNIGRDGTDLDAVLCSPDGQLSVVEFKRKYPATGHQVFGLDLYPHVRTIETMDKLRIRNLHLLLVSPVWDTEESPLDWLRDKKLNNHWTWLAAVLSGSDFPADGPLLHTSGEDSGQREFERIQHYIPWNNIYLLNNGLFLNSKASADLLHFLRNGTITGAPQMTYQCLEARRQREYV